MDGSGLGRRIGGIVVAVLFVVSGALGVGPGALRPNQAAAAAGSSAVGIAWKVSGRSKTLRKNSASNARVPPGA